MKIHIREFIFPDDYQEVITLWQNAGDGIHLRISDEPDEILKKIQRDPDLFMVAEVDGKIGAAIMGGFDGRRGMMYHLAVDKCCRRLGIASLLVDELEARLRKKGCIRYYLLVTKDNAEAIRFYEQRGHENLDDLYIYGKDI